MKKSIKASYQNTVKHWSIIFQNDTNYKMKRLKEYLWDFLFQERFRLHLKKKVKEEGHMRTVVMSSGSLTFPMCTIEETQE